MQYEFDKSIVPDLFFKIDTFLLPVTQLTAYI